MRETLPIVGVPLTNGYADIPLNLQTAIDIVYQEGRYAKILDYDDRVPPPALSAEDAQWVQERIAQWRQSE